MLYISAWILLTVLIGALISMTARWFGPQILIGAFSGSLIIAILMAPKLGFIPGFEDYSLSASIFIFSATFIFTDVLAEVYGKKAARNAVYSGILLYPLLILTTKFAIEWDPHPVWEEQQSSFANVMGMGMRTTLASFCGFCSSQLHDVWAFHYWKEKTGDKHLWFRNNASTIVSQFIATVVFYTIAFYGIFPLFNIIAFTFLVKIVIAVIDTPVVYFVVDFVRKGSDFKANNQINV